MKPRLQVSFSGGETSAYMAQRIKTEWSDVFDIVYVFANTGKELPATIEFIRQCDEYFGLNVRLIEATFHKDTGTRSKEVTYATMAMKGEPFAAFIAKHGIPNKLKPGCSRDLKAYAMRHFVGKTLGWGNTYQTAIGIRADEFDRISDSAKKERLIYPLIKWGVTRADVLEFWSKMPFRLRIMPHEGNCDMCWKKSLRKLLTIAKESPERTQWWADMESQYSTFATPKQKSMQARIDKGIPRVFNRMDMTMEELIRKAQNETFDPWRDGADNVYDPELDSSGNCSESCEVF